MLNKVMLIGRLGRDPETRYAGGGEGTAVCNFSLATDESYKGRNGERQKRTEWHRVVMFGKPAENAQQILKKGSLTCVEGKIQSREWQDKEGQKRTAFEIVASHFLALDPKPSMSATEKKSNGGVPKAQIPSGGPEIDDNDIPF